MLKASARTTALLALWCWALSSGSSTEQRKREIAQRNRRVCQVPVRAWNKIPYIRTALLILGVRKNYEILRNKCIRDKIGGMQLVYYVENFNIYIITSVER